MKTHIGGKLNACQYKGVEIDACAPKSDAITKIGEWITIMALCA